MPTCLAPWHALTIKWGGNVIPDIIYKGKLGNINKKTLKQILEGEAAQDLRRSHRDRVIPEVCQNCAKKEKNGRSRRMFFWDKIDYDVRMQAKNLEVDNCWYCFRNSKLLFYCFFNKSFASRWF